MADVVTSPGSLAAAPSAAPEDARWRVIARNAFPFIVVFSIWEIVARAGIFPPRLFPSLVTVAQTFVQLTIDGILPHHVLDTILRLLSGFSSPPRRRVLGILMGRSRRFEDIVAAAGQHAAPIPGLAYAPLFLLWFGLGNQSAVLLVAFVSAFPIIFNTWTGVKAVKEIWVRSAQAMGADDRRLFVKVIVPGALPYILTGLRLGLAQAWRILVGVEMLAAVPWGLGWMIFGAREFLNTDVMLAGVVVIGITRPGAGEAGVPEARTVHRHALGDDDVSAVTTSGAAAGRQRGRCRLGCARPCARRSRS